MSGQALDEITNLNRKLTRINESIEETLYEMGTPPGMRYDSIRVQSTHFNRMESLVVKLDALKKQAVKIHDEIDARKAIIEEIQTHQHIFTNDEWRLVECRFFEGYGYHRIEDETGFSFRKIRRLMGRIKSKNICLYGGIY